jgi:aminoglycoside phosphotransferase family enzyme
MRSGYTTASKSTTDASVSLDDKLDFLSAPENFPERTGGLQVTQTHHAWLFFTDRHVYKMKKPIRYGRIDYVSLESRRHGCEEECRLNRRLAARTYIRAVPLVIDQQGQLKLDSDGCTVEWLIKMHRLPRIHMLEIAAPQGLVSEGDIACLLRKLFRFYRDSPDFHFASGAYAGKLRERVAELRQELVRPRFCLSTELVNEVAGDLDAYIDSHLPVVEQRQQGGHIRDVHGDLRPEHVCLWPRQDPQVIDCLEFDAELRRLDCMEELAFFGMECRHMGQAWIERQCLRHYRTESGDAALDADLWNFYAALRAVTRAMHCVWHLLDSKTIRTWTNRAQEYLEEARVYLAHQS